MSNKLKLIVSYRKNTGTARRPNWTDWQWSYWALLDSPALVADVVSKYNSDKDAFPDLQYKIEAGLLNLRKPRK